MNSISTGKTIVFLLLAAWLAGCVQTKPVPGYARAGDNIVLGLGGVERNAGGASTLNPSDLTITLTDASTIDHTLGATVVFKSYSDYASQLNADILSGQVGAFGLSDMVPFDGGWFAVVPLTYPGQPDNPLPLAVGPATISVTSPKLTNINNSIEGDLSAIPFEIIAGTSAPDSNYVRQFLGYSRTTHNFVVAPDNLTGISEVGGGYFVINYSDDSFFKAGTLPAVVPAEHNPYVQLSYNVVPNGDGTGSIYVTVLNPAGFKSTATSTANSSLLSNLSFRLLYTPDFTIDPVVIDQVITDAKASFSIDGAQSYYIDMSGAVVAGLAPTIAHITDL